MAELADRPPEPLYDKALSNLADALDGAVTDARDSAERIAEAPDLDGYDEGDLAVVKAWVVFATEVRDQVHQVKNEGLAALGEEEFFALQRVVSREAYRRTKLRFVAALEKQLPTLMQDGDETADWVKESGGVDKIKFHTTDYENGFFFVERSPVFVLKDGSEIYLEFEDPDDELQMASADLAVHHALGSASELIYDPATRTLTYEGP